MRKKFALYFDRDGCAGLDAPQSESAEQTAEDFAFLRRISVAVQDFDDRVRRIEQAYLEFQNQ